MRLRLLLSLFLSTTLARKGINCKGSSSCRANISDAELKNDVWRMLTDLTLPYFHSDFIYYSGRESAIIENSAKSSSALMESRTNHVRKTQ